MAASPCTFVRNGSDHTGPEARDHMQLKYDHARRRVKTAEDFIRLAASQSSMTGRPYLVRCADEPEATSRDWLLERLLGFRNGGT